MGAGGGPSLHGTGGPGAISAPSECEGHTSVTPSCPCRAQCPLGRTVNSPACVDSGSLAQLLASPLSPQTLPFGFGSFSLCHLRSSLFALFPPDMPRASSAIQGCRTEQLHHLRAEVMTELSASLPCSDGTDPSAAATPPVRPPHSLQARGNALGQVLQRSADCPLSQGPRASPALRGLTQVVHTAGPFPSRARRSASHSLFGPISGRDDLVYKVQKRQPSGPGRKNSGPPGASNTSGLHLPRLCHSTAHSGPGLPGSRGRRIRNPTQERRGRSFPTLSAGVCFAKADRGQCFTLRME